MSSEGRCVVAGQAALTRSGSEVPPHRSCGREQRKSTLPNQVSLWLLVPSAVCCHPIMLSTLHRGVTRGATHPKNADPDTAGAREGRGEKSAPRRKSFPLRTPSQTRIKPHFLLSKTEGRRFKSCRARHQTPPATCGGFALEQGGRVRRGPPPRRTGGTPAPERLLIRFPSHP
jgi:hypothetical protein